MTTLKQVSFEDDFFWKGVRYTQVIRPKTTKGKFIIVCRPTREPCGKWVDMPAGRKVKPVIILAKADTDQSRIS